MLYKFEGSFEDLKAKASAHGLGENWVEDGHGKRSLKAPSGGILNWWQSKGTLQVQGKETGRAQIELFLTSLEGAQSEQNSAKIVAQKPKSIFIVHGHDTEAMEQLELFLRRLQLTPFILMNSSGGGKTIIEALEGQIGRDYSADFGIILMTPDDMGYTKDDGRDKEEPRARQNVIFEAGMLVSSLTRKRIAFIVKGHIEMPSDLQGVLYLGYNEKIREIGNKLCARLREAGFDFNHEDQGLACQ